MPCRGHGSVRLEARRVPLDAASVFLGALSARVEAVKAQGQ
jgi:hypothetical protein